MSYADDVTPATGNPPDPARLARQTIPALADATERLLAAVAGGVDTGAASSLPHWTVGHVLTHLARNGDAQRNLLHWAATGDETPMYPSRDHRAADIEAGAGRPAAEIVADVAASAEQLSFALDAFPPERWSAVLRTSPGTDETTADVIPAQRLAEVELHHHDLGIDGGLALLEQAQQLALLHAVLRSYARTRELQGLLLAPDGADPIRVGGPTPQMTTVVGPAASIAGWLAGRSDGADLRCDGPLPSLPPW